MRGLLGRKIGMTQVFTEYGEAIPVTVLEVGPCVVTQVKTIDSDGYKAVQLGFDDKKEKHSNKPMNGHFAKAGTSAKKLVAEFEPITGVEYKPGQTFKADLFREGDLVTVSGVSKGKGLEVVQVDVDQNKISVKGAVPGGKNGFIAISK